jgi:nucleoside-diphosphate-sugar epimerase
MLVGVTGATGFIGGHLVRRLAAAGHEVVALGRRPDAAVAGAGRYLAWDLGSAAAPPQDLEHVDAVVHPAAHVLDWGPWDTFDRVTVEGTRRLIDVIGPARLIVIGSASVYDPFRGHLRAREEEAPVARYRNGYGRSKAMQERLVRARRPDALVLRPRLVYGRGDRTLLPRLVAARRLGFLPLPGGGRHLTSVTHVDSLADAVVAGLDRPHVAGPVNVTDAQPVMARQMIADALAALGLRTRILDLPTPLAWPLAAAVEGLHRGLRRPGRPAVTTYTVGHLAWPFVLDTTRLGRDLGIRPDRHYADHLAELTA